MGTVCIHQEIEDDLVVRCSPEFDRFFWYNTRKMSMKNSFHATLWRGFSQTDFQLRAGPLVLMMPLGLYPVKYHIVGRDLQIQEGIINASVEGLDLGFCVTGSIGLKDREGNAGGRLQTARVVQAVDGKREQDQ
jgi:hypothetical protein